MPVLLPRANPCAFRDEVSEEPSDEAAKPWAGCPMAGGSLPLTRSAPTRPTPSALGPSERKDAVRGHACHFEEGAATDLACPQWGTGCQLVTEERLHPFAVVLPLGGCSANRFLRA